MNVLNFKKPTFWVSAAVTVLLAAVLIGLALDPKKEDYPAEPTEQVAVSEEQTLTEEQIREELTVFYGNDTAEFLLSRTVMVSEISTDEIIGQLKEAAVFSEDVRLLHMEIDAGGCMSLNFNSALGRQLGMYGSAGEYLMVGSMVNTFLTAFPECDRVQILIEGEPCDYGHMDYSQPFEKFTNVETTILASIAIEGQNQKIEMSRIAAASGFAINYDRERFELQKNAADSFSLSAKVNSLTAQLDCWKSEGGQSDVVSELKKLEFDNHVSEEHVILEQQGYDAVKLSDEETSADVRIEYYVIGDGSASWVIRLTYSPESEEGLLPEMMYTLNSFQILH